MIEEQLCHCTDTNQCDPYGGKLCRRMCAGGFKPYKSGRKIMKHKHADLIHAWADGAEIQIYNGSVGEWQDTQPTWTVNNRYRIKPEEKKPVVRWLWTMYCHMDKRFKLLESFYTEEEAKHSWVKLDWSRQEFPE